MKPEQVEQLLGFNPIGASADLDLLGINDDALNQIVLMLQHIPVYYIMNNKAAMQYVFEDRVKQIAVLAFPSKFLQGNHAIEEHKDAFIKASKQMNKVLRCDCDAHKALKTMRDGPLKSLLISLQQVDASQKLLDHPGAHCIIKLLNYLTEVTNLKVELQAKSANLQVACKIIRHDMRWHANATPDFVGTTARDNDSPVTVAVGEVQSLPYSQLVLAGLGHLSTGVSKYALGFTLSKVRCVKVYILTNKNYPVVLNDDLVGPITLSMLTSEDFILCDLQSLKRFFSIVYSSLQKVLDNIVEDDDNVPCGDFIRNEILSRKRPHSPSPSKDELPHQKPKL